MRIKKAHKVARCAYICMLTAYTILREIIPLQTIVGNGLVVAGIFGLGLLMIAANLWLDRDHATKANVGLFIAFIVACGLSTLINFRFEFLSNVKAIAWMLLFFFLVYPCGFHSKSMGGKEISAIFVTAFITLLIAVIISLPMYFFNIHYTYVTNSQFDNVLPQGFHSEYLRLWGIFADPNTAAVYSFVALLMSLYIIAKKKNVAIRVVTLIGDLLFVTFIVLSGSRTAKVAVIIASIWIAFYSAYTLLKNQKQLKRVILSLTAVILAAIASWGSFFGITNALPHVKKGMNSLLGETTNRSIHLLYDNVYETTDLNITDGFWSAPSIDDGKEDDEPIEDLDRPDLEGKGDVSNGRFAKWGDYFKIFAKTPIFGASPRGISAFGKVHCPDTSVAKYDYVSHNFLLEIMLGTGVIGLCIILLVLLNAAFIIMRTTLQKQFAFKYLIHSSIILTLICASMFLSDLFFNLTFGGFAFFLALGFVNGENEYVDLNEFEGLHDGKKRILIYGPKDPAGGVEKVVIEYVKAIVKVHDDVSFDFLQYGNNFSMEKQIEDLGCRVLYFPSRGKNYFKYKRALAKIFCETRYVAVWGNYSGLTNIDLLILAKKYGIPVRIAHSHGSRLYWGNSIMKYVVCALHHYNKFFVNDYVTDYWACSEMAGKFMFPTAVYDKLHIIKNAVDTTKFCPNSQKKYTVRKEIKLSDEDIVVGHVARLCEVKNQIFLLRVIKAAIEKNKNVRLLLVGSGEWKEKLEEEVKSLGIGDKVLFLGERKDVEDVLQAMDVFVLTSLSEGLSVSAIEAQACGLPCVLPTTVSPATDVTGHVRFLSLEESYSVWAETILQQTSVKTENVQEKICASGYAIHLAAEEVYKLFVKAE